MIASDETRTELRAMIRLALPLVAGQVLLFGVNVIDTLLAGHLGPQVLSAVALGGQVWMLPLMALQGMMFVVPARVSQLMGAGKRADVGALFRQILFLAVTMGVLVLMAIRLAADAVGPLLGVAPDIAEGAAAFLRAIAWAGPPLAVFMACRGLSDGLSLTRPAMWFGLLGLLLLIPIGYALMYGAVGIAPMGAYGSGLATALVIWIQAALFVGYVATARPYRGIGWGCGRLGPDRPVLAGLLRLGVPMAVSVTMEVSMFSVAAFAIARFGAVQIAAHQIALNVAGLAFMVPLGLSGAITVRVGMALGAGDMVRARLAGLLGITLAACIQTISCALMVAMPAGIAALYTADADVQGATVSLLAFAALFQFSDAVQVAANGALRGLQDTRYPAVITLLAYWVVGMPLGLVLAFAGHMAARGMWVGLLAGLSVAAVLLTWRFMQRTLAAVRHDVTLDA